MSARMASPVNALFCLLLCVAFVFPARAQMLKSAISVTDLKISATVQKEQRPYLAARADSSAEVLWVRESDVCAMWTSLNYDTKQGDTRRVADFELKQNNRTGASGFVALPGGAIAMVSIAGPQPLYGVHKWLREFTPNAKLLREAELPAHEEPGGGWEIGADELMLGFRRGRNQMEYTYWAETQGGGHYGSRSAFISFAHLKRVAGTWGCSHSLAMRGVHNHEDQNPGLWCLKDGFSGIYQFNRKDLRTYAFDFSYGYQVRPLGDVVPYKEGFLLTMGAQRNTDGREHAPRDTKKKKVSWKNAKPAGLDYENSRTDLGLIFQTWTDGVSLPCCITWLTETPDKMESWVHAGWYGPNQDKLAVFYVEHDARAIGGSPTGPDARYMVQKVNPEPIRQYHKDWMANGDPSDYQPLCPIGCGDPKGGKFGPVLDGAAEEIGDVVHWIEHQSFTSFPNGDIGWVTNFLTDESGVVDHTFDAEAVVEDLKLVRVKFSGAVDGGWTDWSACDCNSLKQKRVCAKPVPVNGGAMCSGEAEESCQEEGCVDTGRLPTTYPVGHDPVSQDPGGGAWFENTGGCRTYFGPLNGCMAHPLCCLGGLKCYARDDTWAGCLPDCEPGVHTGDDVPWTCTEIPKGNWVYHENRNNVAGRVDQVGLSNAEIKYLGSFDNMDDCVKAAEADSSFIGAVTWHSAEVDDEHARTCYGDLSPFWMPKDGEKVIHSSQYVQFCGDFPDKCGVDGHGECLPITGLCKCSDGYTGELCSIAPAAESFYWDESGFDACSTLCNQQTQTLTQTVVCMQVVIGGNVAATDAQCQGMPSKSKACLATPMCDNESGDTWVPPTKWRVDPGALNVANSLATNPLALVLGSMGLTWVIKHYT